MRRLICRNPKKLRAAEQIPNFMPERVTPRLSPSPRQTRGAPEGGWPQWNWNPCKR